MGFCKTHNHVEPIDSLDEEYNIIQVCPICWWDKEREKLNTEFLKIYHSTPVKKLARNLHTFLCRRVFLDFGRNKHYVWLLQWSERFYNNTSQELPGQVYGMLSEAWDQLIANMNKAKGA